VHAVRAAEFQINDEAIECAETGTCEQASAPGKCFYVISVDAKQEFQRVANGQTVIHDGNAMDMSDGYKQDRSDAAEMNWNRTLSQQLGRVFK
jgi:hypothetical protein